MPARRTLRTRLLFAWFAAWIACTCAWADDVILAGVVAHEGQAVADVGVVARPLVAAWEFHAGRSPDLRLDEKLASTPKRRASTDASGRYSLALPSGVWSVQVSREGYEPSCMVALTSSHFRELPLLDLRRSPRHLRWIDSEGRPVGAARLRLRPAETPEAFEWSPCDREVIVDAETGDVSFHASRGSVGFVYAPGFRELRLEEDLLLDPPREVRLSACPPVPQGVRVTETADGQGVADALLLGGDGAWPLGISSETGEIEFADGGCFENFTVLIRDGRRLGSIRLIPKIAGDDTERSVIELPPARRARGRIMHFDDEANQVGIADAGIRSRTDPRLWAAAEDGYFELPHLPLAGREEDREASISLLAFAPGFQAELYEVRVPSAPGELPFLPLALFPLRPTVTFTGQIVGADGDPVPGATVELFSTPPGPIVEALALASSPTSPHPPGISDLSGHFSVSAPPSTYDLLIRHPEHSPRVVPRLIAARDGETRDLGALALLARWSLRGHITDEDGQPVAGAEVAVLHRARGTGGAMIRETVDQSTGIVESRADGSFSLSGLPLLENRGIDIRARKAGYRGAFLRNVRAPIKEAVQLELRRNARVEGVVYDLQRRPVEGARVRVDQESSPEVGHGERPMSDSLSTTTDADGRFLLPDLAPLPIRLQVTADDHLPATRWVEMEPGASAHEEILLEPAGDVSGYVVDSEGRAVEDARVQAAGSRTLTEKDGSFVLSDVPVRDAVTVLAEKVDVGRAESTVVPGGARERIEIILRPSVVFRGRVLDPRGEPVVAATVEISDPEGMGRSHRQLTGSDGEFEFSTLDEGEYALAVSQYGLHLPPEQSRIRVPDDSPANIVLTSGGRIEGDVTGLGEAERARAVIEASCATGFVGATHVQSDGSYQIDVPLGECLLSGRVSGADPTSFARVLLTRDEPRVRENLHLGVERRIEGRIQLNGAPLADAGLTLLTPVGIAAAERTDWQGEFELPELADGTYLLKIESTSLSLPAFFEVRSPSAAPLLLSIQTGSLTLDLADQAGRAIRHARMVLRPTDGLSAYPPRWISHELRTDGGTVYFPAIPPGHYLIHTSAAGKVPTTLPLQISEGDDSTVALTLRSPH